MVNLLLLFNDEAYTTTLACRVNNINVEFWIRELVNNHVFFQHPDLIRILRVHENVMALMMNTLGRAQAQSEAQEKSQQVASPGQEGEQVPKEKVFGKLYFKLCLVKRNLCDAE